MKKLYFYGMVIVCLFCTATIHAQTDRFWIHPAATPGDWNDPNNWSTIAGGSGGASVPNTTGFNARFTQGGTVNVDMAVPLNMLRVEGTTLVQLIATTSNSSITVNSATVGSEGLRIETGSTLELHCAGAVAFDFNFADNSRGVINGTWHFTGITGIGSPAGATFHLPASAALGNQVDVFGTIRFGNNTRIPLFGPEGPAYLHFRDGSTYWLDRNGGAAPPADWAANSTILLTGIINAFPIINAEETPQIGNLVVNCPAMAPSGASIVLSLNGLDIQGNLEVLNTNNQPLTLLSIATDFPAVTVGGDLNISGSSIVYIGEDGGFTYNLSVGGDFNLSGGSFLMQLANGVGTNPTVLSLQGNLNHTGGTLGISSADQSTTTDLFVIELNGTDPQTISSTGGVIDDANNMLTLRLNNAAGASLLSPVTVGKLSWNSTNKGILTTTASNYITVTNPDATNTTVINGAANNGYVNGPIRRVTNSTGTYYFPTGNDNLLRYAEIIPATTAASQYSAEYIHAANASTSVQIPLTGVSNVEYWNISRISGSAAAIRLNLVAQVPGAAPSDAIVVAGLNGTTWLSRKGTNGTFLAGNAASGIVSTDQLGVFNGAFTFGFGPAGALPIDLVSFDAKKLSGTAALLTWSVTASSTPDRFEVLRSTDGSSFSAIGTVQSADLKLNYSFTDNNLPAGTTYYRLRMVDKNGEVTLSHVATVTNGTDGLFLASMAPTIVVDRARIKVTSVQRGNLQLVITDMSGRIVKQQINGIDAGTQEIWLNLQSLASGVYQITGYVEGKRSASLRFIKQ